MERLFARLATHTARAAGAPLTFLVCLTLVVLWAVSGPFFGFSDTWELVINTGTTIVTFLMVFLIQNSQNRDSAALQAKLDELIRASDAENDFMGIEKLTDAELEQLHAHCSERAARSQAMLEKTTEHRSQRQARKTEPA